MSNLFILFNLGSGKDAGYAVAFAAVLGLFIVLSPYLLYTAVRSKCPVPSSSYSSKDQAACRRQKVFMIILYSILFIALIIAILASLGVGVYSLLKTSDKTVLDAPSKAIDTLTTAPLKLFENIHPNRWSIPSY